MVYPIGKLIIIPIYKLWLRKVQGLENIPKDKPFIIAANHASYYDAALLHCIIIPKINKIIRALVDSAYWNNVVNKTVLNWGECIPVFVENEPGAKNKNKKSIEEAIKYLKNRGIVQIFPEGTRSKDGKLKKAYNGVAKLALKTKVSVLPVGIIDSHKVLPKGKIFPRFKRCEVKIGKPIHFENYYDKKFDNKTLEEVTRRIMKQIGKLIGQKYPY